MRNALGVAGFAIVVLLVMSSVPVAPVSAAGQTGALSIYTPPSVEADGHSYPFMIQATSNGVPVNTNGTLYITASSPELTPQNQSAKMAFGQAIVSLTALAPNQVATPVSAVQITASSPGFTSATVSVVIHPQYAPYDLSLVAPGAVVAGAQFPVLTTEYVNGAPFTSSLSYYLTGDQPSQEQTNSFGGQSYILSQFTFTGTVPAAAKSVPAEITAAGDQFSAFKAPLVIYHTGVDCTAGGCSLQAAAAKTITLGTWPVIVYMTNGTRPGSVSGSTVFASSDNPAVLSVQPQTTAGGYYDVVDVTAASYGTATVTFQAAGFSPTSVSLTVVRQSAPYTFASYGPPTTYANPAAIIELETPSGLPVHGGIAAQLVFSTQTSTMPLTFADGFAFVNLSTPESSTGQVQAPNAVSIGINATRLYVPFVVTLESDSPVAFSVESDGATYSVPSNSSILLKDRGTVTAPFSFVFQNGTLYTFKHWSDGSTDNVRNLTRRQALFATYSSESILVTVTSAIKNVTVSIQLPGQKAVTEHLPIAVPAPAGLNITVPSIVPFSAPGVQYAFSGWSDGGNATSRFLAAGTTVSVNYKIQFEVQVTSAYGTVSGSGYYDAGSVATISVTPTVVPGGFLSNYVLVGWQTQGGTTNGKTLQLTVTGTETVKAVWVLDRTMLIIFLAGIVAAAVFVGWLSRSKQRNRIRGFFVGRKARAEAKAKKKAEEKAMKEAEKQEKAEAKKKEKEDKGKARLEREEAKKRKKGNDGDGHGSGIDEGGAPAEQHDTPQEGAPANG